MKGNLIKAVTILVFLLSALSCSDNSLLFYGDDERVDITGVARGELIEPGGTLPLILEASGEESYPDRLEIELRDLKGEILTENVFSGADLQGTLPPLSLPDLPADLYLLQLRLFQGEELLLKKEIELFLSGEAYSVQSLASLPAIVSPGGYALLEMKSEAPAGEDPFIRWSIDGRVLKSGFLSQGLDRILWRAPEGEGVYRLKAELFPYYSDPDFPFLFDSPVSQEISVYVSTEQMPGARELTELVPDGQDDGGYPDYTHLYHFRGNLKDERGSGGSRARYTAPPLWNRYLDYFGLELDAEHGVTEPLFLLPTAENEAGSAGSGYRIQPFVFEMVFVPAAGDSPSGWAAIMETSYDEEALAFSLGRTAQGRLAARFKRGGEVLESLSELLLTQRQRPFFLSLRVYPDGESVAVDWFIDGEPAGAEILQGNWGRPLRQPPASGRTIWGGSPVTGILDEAGIKGYTGYNREAFFASGGQYLRAMAIRYGSDLVTAEGFESAALPDGLRIHGEAAAEGGILRLAAGSRLSLPPLVLGSRDAVYEVEFIGRGLESLDFLLTAEDEAFAPLSFSLPEGDPLFAAESLPGDPLRYRLQLALREDQLSLLTSQGAERRPVALEKGDALNVSLARPAGECPEVWIESYLVLRN